MQENKTALKMDQLAQTKSIFVINIMYACATSSICAEEHSPTLNLAAKQEVFSLVFEDALTSIDGSLIYPLRQSNRYPCN